MKPKTRTPDPRQGDLLVWAASRPTATVIDFRGPLADECFARRLWARLDTLDDVPDHPGEVVQLRA